MHVRKRKVTLNNYITKWCAVIVLVVIVLFLTMNILITEVAFRESVRNRMYTVSDKYARKIVEDNGSVYFLDEPQTDDYKLVILSETGEKLYGTYPEGFGDIGNKVYERRKMVQLEFDNQKFYVMDRHTRFSHGEETQKHYVVRMIMPEKEVSMIVFNIRMYMCLGVVIAAVLVSIFTISIKKKISVPLDKMCMAADRISENLDFSDAIEYDGQFREIHALIDANNRLFARMEEVVDRQNQFNSDVSHELRTPISVIQAQCQVSREEAEKSNNREMLEMLEVIERQSAKMKDMVEQLLNLSRLEQQTTKLNIEAFDLSILVESACDDFQSISEDAINFKYELESVELEADMNLVMLVIRNLISNAIKYSEAGSEIAVGCGKKDGRVYFKVADNGMGIDEESIKRIFEHYFRVDESRGMQGYGLGLTLVKKIMDYHGGEVMVESKVGVGSTFTVLF